MGGWEEKERDRKKRRNLAVVQCTWFTGEIANFSLLPLFNQPGYETGSGAHKPILNSWEHQNCKPKWACYILEDVVHCAAPSVEDTFFITMVSLQMGGNVGLVALRLQES